MSQIPSHILQRVCTAEAAVAEYRTMRHEFIRVYGPERGICEWRHHATRQRLVLAARAGMQFLRTFHALCAEKGIKPPTREPRRFYVGWDGCEYESAA